MKRNEMKQHLEELGLGKAIADENASVDGSPAIVLRWNGLEEYYTGGDIYEEGSDPFDTGRDEYRSWLCKNFS